MAESLFYLLIFPGITFQLVCGWFFEWFDRKLQARFQRRVGPRWFQPLADLLKLFSKEDLLPSGANEFAAAALPLISLGAVLTAGVYVPIAGFSPASFEGDLIVIIFLLSVPTLAYYLAGIISAGIYSVLGGGRSLLQFFSYEVPLLIALSGPAVMAGTWSIREISSIQAEMGPFVLFQPIGFILAVVGLIGKLKRSPLDIPKAKSEVVAGSLTEFGGVKLAIWNTVMNIQAVVGIFLLVNLYSSWSGIVAPVLAVPVFFLESVLMIFVLSAASAVFARLRIDQLAGLGWKVLVPLALLQLLVVILMGV
ncbi:MAG: NADH-quinone oxidoreductase subunit H [Anaerolineales bacterium]|nr:NADH-quinone oxidoreductase subunit H [Anaerolineales bacterium]MBS3753298.1 NADH-quinone oxidoreductase subunit H [Anaerolineales bacterium]